MHTIQFDIKFSKSFIRLFWYVFIAAAGMAIGFVLFNYEKGTTISMIRMLPNSNQVIPLRLIVVFLPQIFTYIAFRNNRTGLIYLIILFKMMIFGFTTCGICLSFPNAGWLLQVLVLSASWCGMVIYHWLWLRCLVFKTAQRADFLIVTCVLSIIFLVVILFIDPFLASLFVI